MDIIPPIMTSSKELKNSPWREFEPDNVFSIHDAVSFFHDFCLMDGQMPSRVRQRYLDSLREKGEDYDSLHLRAPVQIVEGEEAVLVASGSAAGDVSFALFFLFDVMPYSISKTDYFARIRNPLTDETMEVKVESKAYQKRITRENLVVSQKLAEELRLEEGKDIIITRVYQKVEEVNLDKL